MVVIRLMLDIESISVIDPAEMHSIRRWQMAGEEESSEFVAAVPRDRCG